MSKNFYNNKPYNQNQKPNSDKATQEFDPQEKFEITDITENGTVLLPLISDSGDKNVKDMSIVLSSKGAVKLGSGKIVVDSPLNVNQLRKFYDSFLRIYYLRIPENEKKIKLLMLRANVEYSSARLKISRFAVMMKCRIDIVVKSNGEDFNNNLDAFKLHFEALVAYYPKG
jgi:CRISPR type III-A-associated protein Csm2